MSVSRSAAQHAAAGLELWQQERLVEAEAEYRAALQLAPQDDIARADYHSELAAVLEALGKDQEAEQQLRTALACAVEDDDVSTNVARYFLAGFLIRHGEARRAVDDITPFLIAQGPGVWLLHLAAAEAWVMLGDADAADASARCALRAAPSDDQRSDLRLRLLEIGLHEALV